jgi:hypothetical protein
MEQQALTRRDLEEIIGTRTRIAEVLSRKRGLSIAMIRRLHMRGCGAVQPSAQTQNPPRSGAMSIPKFATFRLQNIAG